MFCSLHPFSHKQHRKATLLFVWSFGFVLGCYFASRTPENIHLLMRTSLTERVSIVGLLSSNLLPVVLLGLALFSQSAHIVFLVYFTMSLAYGFSLISVGYAFGSAAWLVFLVLFIPIFSKGIIWLFFAFRSIRSKRKRIIQEFFVAVALLIALNALDYFTVSPFMADLLY